MKKITGIVFIFIFLLYICGVQLLYSLKINAIRNQTFNSIAKHTVPLNNLTTISFTPEQYKTLNWSERNKEFEYKGKQYDIISLQFYAGEVKIVCFDDSKETYLVSEFTDYVKNMFSQSQKPNENSKEIANNICKEYLSNNKLIQTYFFQVVTTINANCVLVNQHALMADVWRPPSLV